MAKGCATMEGNHNTHGEPLTYQEIIDTKELLGLDSEKQFQLSKDVLQDFRKGYDYARK